MTPLHRAAMFDQWDVVQYLVEKRPETMDQLDNENKNPLLAAAVRGATESFKILLNAGSNLCQRDITGRNVLHHLVTYANFDADTPAILKKITGSCGIELLNQKDIFGCTPLHTATKQGSIKFTEVFVGMGAALNSKDLEYQSPLHFAARNGRLKTVLHLLAISSGQSIINESDSNGKTAVMLACENGHPEVVKLLLQRGAMINRDFTGRSVVHLAAMNGHLDALTELLTFHSNLLDQKCCRGFTALHYAAATNQYKIVEFLLSRKAAYLRDNEGKTPMNIAIDRKATESAITMIKHERSFWIEV
uniref:Ankyrin repeat protein n=1 Tax=Romanomermis culicivorax TaxID=13658 RepID=A0A915JTH2_ROMCU